MIPVERIEYLFDKYFTGTGSIRERDELFELVNTNQHDETLRAIMDRYLSNHMVNESLDKEKAEDIFRKVLSAERTEWIETRLVEIKEKEIKAVGEMNSIRKMLWGIAALLLVMLVSVGIFQAVDKNPVEKAAKAEFLPKSDVPPGGNRAVLTLADGSQISLDGAGKGNLAKQGGSNVMKPGMGELVYSSNNEKPATVLYNTLTVPVRGQYRLVLPDGSKVWLNAASSLKYPTTFNDGSRDVVLTGEGYFEIAKDNTKPFHVNANGMLVEVLGTHFNVSAYGDEPVMRATLLEGSIRLKEGFTVYPLSPGQQAVVTTAKGTVEKILPANTEQVVAWKDGKFSFKDNGIETIMLQLARWYGIEVRYEGIKPAGTYSGSISRDNNLSSVIRMLELNGIRFRIEGNRVTVLP